MNRTIDVEPDCIVVAVCLLLLLLLSPSLTYPHHPQALVAHPVVLAGRSSAAAVDELVAGRAGIAVLVHTQRTLLAAQQHVDLVHSAGPTRWQ